MPEDRLGNGILISALRAVSTKLAFQPPARPAPTVSVVIPAWNAAGYLGEAIESILAQTIQPLEVIVVDDGSTDETPLVAQGQGDRVRCLRVPHGGPARARNAGIRAARGSHIAFLDADDTWLPDKLERQLGLLNCDPELALVYSAISLFDEEGTWLQDVPCQPLCAGRGASSYLRIKNSIQVSTVVAPRAALFEVGLYDPELPACENWDLWIRLTQHGAAAFVDAPLVRYRIHRGSLIQDVDRMRGARLQVLARHHQERNRSERRRAFALSYLDSGIGYLEHGRRGAAAVDLVHSLWIRPSLAPLVELARVGLPARLRRSLGRLRRRMQKRR
jgi:glycosyltransferase involved in cell wall biosynthesis